MTEPLMYSPETALASATAALHDKLNDVLDAKTAYDSTGDLYGPSGLPHAAYIGPTPPDDLAIDMVAPGVFLEYRLGTTQDLDASLLLNATPTLEVTVLLTEQATDTADPAQFTAQIHAYLMSVAYVLGTWWPATTSCRDAGIMDARLLRIDPAPLTRVSDRPMWVRYGRVVLQLQQRIFNQWDIVRFDPVPVTVDEFRNLDWYVFKIPFTVTGTATPLSAVNVNGSSVAVGSDGKWSYFVNDARDFGAVIVTDGTDTIVMPWSLWTLPDPASPFTLTFEGEAGFYWDPDALSDLQIDWGDGGGYEQVDPSSGTASKVYGDSDPRAVKVLIEAKDGYRAEICPNCEYVVAINDFGTQLEGMGDPLAGWFPQNEDTFLKQYVTSWPAELPPQLTQCQALCAGATFLQSPAWDYSHVIEGLGMFGDCSNLAEFTGYLSSLENAFAMFADCTSLTTFDADMSSVTNAAYMFNECTSLSSFDADMSSVTNAQEMFQSCTSLTTFDADMSSVTNAAYMFNECTSLSSFDADMSSVTNAESMFYICTSLTSFEGDMSSVKNAYGMFSGCTSLATFEGDMSSVTNAQEMFYNCTSLTSFEGDMSSVTSAAYMFDSCSSLTSVIPTSTANVMNMYRMFQYCTNFNQDISDWCVEKIPSKPGAFDSGAGFENQPELQPQWGAPCSP